MSKIHSNNIILLHHLMATRYISDVKGKSLCVLDDPRLCLILTYIPDRGQGRK